MNFVKSIQKKPKHIRVKFFLTIMCAAFFIIFAIWLNSIKSNFDKSEEIKVEDNEGSYKTNLPTIYESLSSGIKDVFKPQKIKLK